MRTITPHNTENAQRVLAWLLTVVACALLGFTIAYWTWAWFAPRTQSRIEAEVPAAGAVAAASGLFGKAASAADDAAIPAGAILLLGIMAAADSRAGRALVRVDGNPSVAVRAGEDIEPGLQLVEVHADHIVLDRGGAQEALVLPAPGRSPETAPPHTAN